MAENNLLYLKKLPPNLLLESSPSQIVVAVLWVAKAGNLEVTIALSLLFPPVPHPVCP